MTQPPQTPLQIQMNMPPEKAAGSYASFAGVWQDNDGFVLDFAVTTQPPVPATDDSGNQIMVLGAEVVSRVRIPPNQAWELMKALNDQLGKWEAAKGPLEGKPPNA